MHGGERLSVLGEPERQLLVPATELATENGAERRAAQGELAARAIILVTPPARLLLCIKPRQGSRLTGRVVR